MKKFLPFGQFAPDAPDMDSPHLEVVACVVPWAGEYRPMDSLGEVSREGSAGSAINGSIGHLVTQSAAKNHARPDDTEAPGGTRTIDTEGNVSLGQQHTVVDETVPDDNDYVTWRTDDNGTTTLRLGLADVVDPTSSTDHYVRARFRFIGAPNDYELEMSLKQAGVIVDPGADPCTWAYDEASYQTGAWYEVAELLAGPQADTLTSSGSPKAYDDLALEFIFTLSAITGPDTQVADPEDDENNEDAWTRSSDDSTADIYTVINEGSPIDGGDSDWIATPELALDESAAYICNLSSLENPRNSEEHAALYRFAGEGMDLSVSLLEEVDGEDVVRATRTHESIDSSSATTGGLMHHWTADAALMYDDSAGTYVDETEDVKDFGTANVDLLPNPPDVDDAFYVGTTEKFGYLNFDIDTGSGGSTDLTVAWEYWNGSAWVTLGTLNDNTDNMDVSGQVTSGVAAAWETNTIDGKGPYYYARGRVSAVPGSPTQPVANSVTVVGPDSGSLIVDYSKLKYKFEFTAQSTGGTDQDTRPNSDVSLGLWTDDGGGTSNIYQSIDEATASDSDYITSTDTATNPKYRFTITGQSQPSDHTETKLKIRAKYTGGSGQPDLFTRIYYDGTSQSVPLKIKNLTTTWKTYTLNLDPAESEALDWGTDFTVEIEKQAQGASREIYVSWIELQSVSSANQGRIYNAYLETPEAYGMDLSYTELEVPDTTEYTQPDNIVIYAGNENSLYKVENTGFTDVSVTSDGSYAGNDVEPASWSFCSWGDDVVATNYEDPVQFYDTSVGGARYTGLITEPSSNPPQAKYCGVVSQFLVLGNLTNRSGYGEYSVWWSAINNPAEFYEGDPTTQSDYQHLRDTPGSITGIVGGSNLGLIFKINSIYQMVYAGPPLTFAFHVLSRAQGTNYPRSIVAVGQDIYFLGNGGFFVLRGGTELQPIGDGQITKMFLDAAYGEPRAMTPENTESVLSRDGHVIGSYDPFSGLVFWSYRDAASTALQNEMILVYNPKENAWAWCGDVALLNLDTSSPESESTWASAISDILSVPNIHSPETSIFKTSGVFEWYPGDDEVIYKRFSNVQPYDAIFKTKIMSVAAMLQTEQAIGKDFYLRGIKPVLRGEPTTTDPEVEIVVSSSDDLLMLAANTTSETLVTASRNTDGWYVLSDRLEGEYWTYEMRVHSNKDANVENISGLALDYELAGDV